MFNSRVISLTTILLVQPLTANADRVDTELQRCAVAALAERQQSAVKISVNSSGLTRADLDHDRSMAKSTYKMKVSIPDSEENLGLVTCVIDMNGELVNAKFDS